jgi:gliding motility-associated-like protein
LVLGTGDTDNASFTIDGSSLNANNTSFNFETKESYNLRLRTEDGRDGAFEKAFIITVNNVNEAPFTLSLTNNTIQESDQAQDVGSLMSLDPDIGDSFTYSLVSGTGSMNNADFTTDGTTLKTAGMINFESGATRSILIRVTDAGGLTFDQQFSINIEEVVIEPIRNYGTNTVGAEVKNVFSPNGDGVNETWIIDDIKDNPINEVKVYAQGGKLIYSKVNYQNDWGGTFNNDPVPDGTYYYEINIYNGERIIKGFLTIIRNR